MSAEQLFECLLCKGKGFVVLRDKNYRRIPCPCGKKASFADMGQGVRQVRRVAPMKGSVG